MNSPKKKIASKSVPAPKKKSAPIAKPARKEAVQSKVGRPAKATAASAATTRPKAGPAISKAKNPVKPVAAKTPPPAGKKPAKAPPAAPLKPTARATQPKPAKASAKTGPVAKASAKTSPAPPAKPSAKAGPVADARHFVHRPKQTPAVFKLPGKKQTPIIFTLEDVREVLKNRAEDDKRAVASTTSEPAPVAPVALKEKRVPVPAPANPQATPPPVIAEVPGQRILGPAALADILGFNPATINRKVSDSQGREVPRKWAHYHRLLSDLRLHFEDELDRHTKETLQRSAKEDSGDLSGYSQHMADAGTDTFDRDFALSLVSNEKEALAEIDAAIERIFTNNYGVCEITGQPIAKDRLEAIPFTRYSLEGQMQVEKNQRRKPRGGYLPETAIDGGPGFAEEDSDE